MGDDEMNGKLVFQRGRHMVRKCKMDQVQVNKD